MSRNLIAWSVFAAFLAGALALEWHDAVFRFDGSTGAAKAIVWIVFLLFTGYSIYCSKRESIFRSIERIARLHWGRQIGIDLYLGLLLALSIICLHEGPVTALLWLIPVLLFGNLATLWYVVLNFESLVARFSP
jgi:hypothetical protein